MEHENSRVIHIVKAPKFSHINQDDPAVKLYLSDSKVSIGAYWEGKSKKRSATGLDTNEKGLILPDLLGISKSDGVKLWYDAIEDFYSGIDTKLPAILEIGLTKNNNEPLSEDNLPINPEHYVIYKHALSHPATAKDASEGALPVKHYLIVDETKDKAVDIAKQDIKDKAMAHYLKIKKDKAKVRQVLSVVGRTYQLLEHDDAVLSLRKKVEESPQEFINAVNDPDLGVKTFIFKLIHHKIVLNEGGHYMIAESSDYIGNSLLEVIGWVKSPESSAAVSTLKLRLGEFSKSETPVISEE